MGWWPDWLTYNTIRRALIEWGGPWADEIGLSILVILVLGLFVRLVFNPLRGR